MSTQIDTAFGDLLKRYRLARGLSQEALAERANLSARGIQDLERGLRTTPRKETLDMLAGALQLSSEERATLEAVISRYRGPRTSSPAPHVSPDSFLPIPPTRLIGREHEVAAITTLLRRAEVHLLTLTGPGGVGKTRLALDVAGELAGECGGAVFVRLAPIREAEFVAGVIAQTLGLHEGAGQSLPQRLAAYFRERRRLLVLDNFEQVLDAADIVADLLASSPGLKILVTSRTRLRLRGEHEFVVPPLPLPGPGHPPSDEAVAASPAVRLFVERAQALQPTLVVDETTAPVVAAICRHVDGLPLAIELAAARVKILPPEMLLKHVESHLETLNGGARDAPDRHRTMRDAIAWSYDLLSAGEQALFRRLSVFAGGCTLEATEVVCASTGYTGGPALDGLASLVDNSLIRQEVRSTHPSSGNQADSPRGNAVVRFGMLETIRAYGMECLEACGELEMTLQAHTAYYLSLAEEVGPMLRGAGQIDGLRLLEHDHANLRAALTRACERGDRITGDRLGSALWMYWVIRGHLTEGRRGMEEIVKLEVPAESTVEMATRARALCGLAWLTWTQGDVEEAVKLAARSVDLAREAGDRETAALALVCMAHARTGTDAGLAADLYDEAFALTRDLKDRWAMAVALTFGANVPTSRGDLGEATRLSEESLILWRQAGERWLCSYALSNLGSIALWQGDLAPAERFLNEALVLARQLGEKFILLDVLIHLGDVAVDRGDAEQALDLYAEALATAKEQDDRWHTGAALARQTRVAWRRGQLAEAEELARNSLAVLRGTNGPVVASAVERVALVACLRGSAGTWRPPVRGGTGHFRRHQTSDTRPGTHRAHTSGSAGTVG